MWYFDNNIIYIYLIHPIMVAIFDIGINEADYQIA